MWRPLVFLLVSGWLACGPAAPPGPEVTSSPAAEPAVASTTARSAGPRSERVVVFLGDSLTAGLGLAEEEAYPARVASALADLEPPVRVVNAGVSGDTSAGGLRRIDWLLRQEPDLLVLQLGTNDGLRGQPLEEIEANLEAIVERCRAAGTEVLLVGLRIPPSYGEVYAEGFAALYPRLASRLGLELVPFLLDGVAGQDRLNQPDGIHPTAAGHEVMAATVAPHVRRLLDET